jgi:hypothetical protein
MRFLPSQVRHMGVLNRQGQNPSVLLVTFGRNTAMKRALLAAAAALCLAAPALAQDVSGRLVLYTSQPDADAQRTVDAFTAAHPEV